jgi:hypothetical protein
MARKDRVNRNYALIENGRVSRVLYASAWDMGCIVSERKRRGVSDVRYRLATDQEVRDQDAADEERHNAA